MNPNAGTLILCSVSPIHNPSSGIRVIVVLNSALRTPIVVGRGVEGYIIKELA